MTIDPALNTLLESTAATQHGRLKASFLLADLEKLTPLFADEATRPMAEEVLQTWADEATEPLRKGMAAAWLSRARAAVSPAVRSALGHVAQGAAAVQTAAAPAVNAVKTGAAAVQAGAAKVTGAVTAPYRAGMAGAEKIGAAAGEKIANSGPMAARRAQAGESAGFAAHQAEAASQNQAAAAAGAEPTLQHESAAAPRMEQPATAPHSEMAAAYARGREEGHVAFAAAAAQHGRVAARHAYRAGLAMAGLGAGAAIAGTAERLSNQQEEPAQKQQHRVAKAAMTERLAKSFNRNLSDIMPPHVRRLAGLNAGRPPKVKTPLTARQLAATGGAE